MGIFLGLVAITIIVWQLAGIALRAWTGFRRNYGNYRAKAIDISERNLTPPSYARQSITALEGLGFRRLGEAEAVVPYVKTVNYWVLVNADNSIQATVIYGTVFFLSSFDETMRLATVYPSGIHIEVPGHQSHVITSSFKDAFEHHLQQVSRFRREYGTPRPIISMADYLRGEEVAQAKYGLSSLRTFLWPDVVRLILFAYGALICVGLSLSWLNHLSLIPSAWSKQDILLITIGLTLPVLPIHEQLSKWAINRFHRDSRKITGEGESTQKWEPYQLGSTAGSTGSEKGIIIRDEIYEDSSRITLERDTPTAPFAIICVIYGWLVHTCYFETLDKAISTFEEMKQQLRQIVADIQRDPETPEIGSKLQEFVNRFP